MKLTPVIPENKYFKGLYPETPIITISKSGVMRLNALAAQTFKFTVGKANYLKIFKDENKQLYFRPVASQDADTFVSQKGHKKEIHFSGETLKNQLFAFAQAPEAHLIRFKIKHYIVHEGNAYYPLEVLETIKK